MDQNYEVDRIAELEQDLRDANQKTDWLESEMDELKDELIRAQNHCMDLADENTELRQQVDFYSSKNKSSTSYKKYATLGYQE